MSPDLREPRDLRVLLHAAGAHERASAGTLDVPGLRSRAHRRRAIRSTGYSAIGVAAAAAIAVGAVALDAPWHDEGPLPPADSPTSSTATTPPDAWPSAVTLDGAVPGCSDAMPELVRPDGEPELTVEPLTQDGPLVAGGAAQIDVTVHGPTDFAINADSPRLVLVRDGVVVATERTGSSDAGIVYSGEETVDRPIQVLELVRCETQGRGAVPLDAGAYDLYVVQDLLRGDLALVDEMERLTIVGGPFPVTVEGAVDDGAVDPHPAVDTLVVSTAGLGPLAVGGAVADSALIRQDPLACEGTDAPARWVADYDDGRNVLDAPAAAFLVRVSEGHAIRIEVQVPGPRTTGGIQVGDTLADVLAAHPEFTRLATADELGEVEAWGVVEDGRTLAVEVAANPAGGGAWSADELGRVVTLVVSAGPYDAPAWGSDFCG